MQVQYRCRCMACPKVASKELHLQKMVLGSYTLPLGVRSHSPRHSPQHLQVHVLVVKRLSLLLIPSAVLKV